MRAPRFRRALVAFAGVCALLPLAAPAAAQPKSGPPKPAAAKAAEQPVRLEMPFEKHTLPNGLEVILHEDRRTPVVAVNVWYHVGSKDEPAGKNGFAHLFEHVMFQGSRHVGEDMFFKYLERAGASDRNGTTNDDRTNYFETVPSNQLALVLWLESDRMGYLLDHANEETFASQREVVKNERRQNYENAAYGLVRQFVREALYPEGHPYHRLTIGTPADLDAASLEDVRAFFRRYYVPNNATLVIAGDIDRARTLELVSRYFGGFSRGSDPAVLREPKPVALPGEKRLHVEADVELSRVVVSWPTPPRLAPGDAELDFVSLILSSGKSSRLYKRLVYELQIAQDVSAYQASGQLSSQFDVVVTLRKGKDVDKALAIVDEELSKLRKAAPTKDEVDRARAKTVSGLVFGMERVTGRANAFNEYNQYAGDPGYFAKEVEGYERITPVGVQTAVAKHLPGDRRVVAIVTPAKGAPRAGRLVKSTETAAAAGGVKGAEPAKKQGGKP